MCLASAQLTKHHSGGRGHVGRLHSCLRGDERLLQRRADTNTNNDLVCDPVARRGVKIKCVDEATTDSRDTRADHKVGLEVAELPDDDTRGDDEER